MLQKRTFRRFWQADTGNRQSSLPNHIIKWMWAKAACRQSEFNPLGHYVPWDPKRSLRQRNDEKHTSWAMKRKRNGLRIMLREKPLGQESELKMQRQWFSKSSKTWNMLKSREWWTECSKRLSRRWWLLSETVWVILQLLMMGRMGKMRRKRQSRESWAKMMTQAGWCAKSRKRYSSAWRGFGRSRWSLMNWHNQDGSMQANSSVNEIWSTAPLNWEFRLFFNCKWMMTLRHLHRQHLGSLWNVLRLSPEYRKCRKGPFNQNVVLFGKVRWSCSRTWTYPALSSLQCPIRHLC